VDLHSCGDEYLLLITIMSQGERQMRVVMNSHSSRVIGNACVLAGTCRSSQGRQNEGRDPKTIWRFEWV